MRLSKCIAALLLALTLVLTGCAHRTAAEQAADSYAQQQIAAAPPHGNLPDYSLPPDKLAAAAHLSTVHTILHFSKRAWGIIDLVLLLSFGIIAWMRDRARAFSSNLWTQGYAFALMVLLVRTLLDLPFNFYDHHLALAYGFSVQGWQSWAVDLAKGFTLNWLLYGLIAVVLFALINRFPRRWWLVFWALAVPFTLVLTYFNPILIDPLFNQFEPLALHYPQLSAQLQQMGVPPERQFLMLASAKTTQPNAYVTGIGPSKRVVIWDTGIEPSQTIAPGTLSMVGHECGHYVLGHVRNGMLMGIAIFIPVMYLVYLFLNAIIKRFGARWRITTRSDLGALAILLLAYTLLNFVQEPITNTISRHVEHDADIYGQEAIHGLVPDPQAAMQQDQQDNGLKGLADPNPNPFVVFWSFSHPATGYRAAFAKVYDPWAPGMEPKYFPKEKSDSVTSHISLLVSCLYGLPLLQNRIRCHPRQAPL